MYTLIGSLKTRSFRVLWCLEELEVEYNHIAALPHSDEVAKLNPSGKVPALLVGDEVILDSVAICQFLADKHGQLTYKAGTIKRGQQDSWTQFALDEVESPLWTHAKHSFFLPKELALADIVHSTKHEFDRAMEILQTRLGDQQFVTGDIFTIPDIILTHCANWAQNIPKWDIPKGPVLDYIERNRSRPAYLKTMQLREAEKGEPH